LLRLVDRYILKQILLTLVFALIALCAIFIVVNFTEQIGNFMDANVEIKTIVRYYLVYLPEILKILTPVSILISCLWAVGRLSNSNEITAMKSGGMGLYRILVPISLIGLLLSGGQYYFNGWIVPNANEEKERISQVYLNKNRANNSITNLAFRDTPQRNVLINFYDAISKTAHNVAIENFADNDFTVETVNENSTVIASETKQTIANKEIATPSTRNDKIKNPTVNKNNKPTIVERIEARTMVWDDENKQWVLQNVITRNVLNSRNNSNNKNSNEKIDANRFAELPIALKITPRQLEKINKKTNEMTFDELKEYILLLSAGGKDVRKMEIEFHAAQALPLANFIVILFAVSFASVKKRGGLAVQIAAAMVIAFSYLIFFEISKPIGLAMNLSPIIVGWSANIIFFICGIISIFNTRT